MSETNYSIVRCGCKVSCCKNCSCFKSHRNCSSSCVCGGNCESLSRPTKKSLQERKEPPPDPGLFWLRRPGLTKNNEIEITKSSTATNNQKKE